MGRRLDKGFCRSPLVKMVHFLLPFTKATQRLVPATQYTFAKLGWLYQAESLKQEIIQKPALIATQNYFLCVVVASEWQENLLTEIRLM